MNDWLTFAVPRRAVGLYIFYLIQQQLFLVGFMVLFTGTIPSLFMHQCLFILGDYTFYKNVHKMLK